MKKLFIFGVMVSFCLPLAVQAAGIGGAETQGQGKFGIGLDQEIVFDRDLKKKSYVFGDEVGGYEFTGTLNVEPKINKLYRTMAKVSYGLLDGLDVYAKLGVVDGEAKQTFSGTMDWSDGVNQGQGITNATGKAKTDNAFGWGLGLKGACDLGDDWLIGADIQYLRHKNKYKTSISATFDYDSLTASGGGDWKGELTSQEWHVAPYVAKRLGNFTPYFGAKYSDLRVKDKDEYGDTEKYKAKHNIGVFAGTECKITDNLSLNLEGRFIDETAMSFGCSWKF